MTTVTFAAPRHAPRKLDERLRSLWTARRPPPARAPLPRCPALLLLSRVRQCLRNPPRERRARKRPRFSRYRALSREPAPRPHLRRRDSPKGTNSRRRRTARNRLSPHRHLVLFLRLAHRTRSPIRARSPFRRSHVRLRPRQSKVLSAVSPPRPHHGRHRRPRLSRY